MTASPTCQRFCQHVADPLRFRIFSQTSSTCDTVSSKGFSP